MKNFKVKMFKSYSISSLVFYSMIVYLVFILFQLVKMVISPEQTFITYDVWATFKLNLLYVIPQLILFPILIFYKFKSRSIFSKRTIEYLNIFAFMCILTPLIKIGFSFILFNKNMIDGSYNWTPYIILGIFSLFISSIFKNGFKIQQENDLTI